MQIIWFPQESPFWAAPTRQVPEQVTTLQSPTGSQHWESAVHAVEPDLHCMQLPPLHT